MHAHRRRWTLAGPLALALVLAPMAARGDDSTSRARAAYDAALEAAANGRTREAAELFREADRLAPNPVALRSALRAAVEAGDAALVLAVVASAEGRALDDALRAELEAARARFAERSSSPPEETVPRPEPHAEQAPPAPVEAPPPSVPPEPTASAPSPPRTREATGDGLSPAWFFGALGVTAGLGVGTIVSGQDTRALHEEFERTGRGADEGRAAQLRTNVLFGVTAAGAVATTVLGVVTLASSDDGPPGTATTVRLLASTQGGALAIFGAF